MLKKTLGSTLSKIDRGYVIIKGTEVFTVNEVGARVFELCNGDNNELKIRETLSKFYNLPTGEIENDIHDYICELLSLDLVKSV